MSDDIIISDDKLKKDVEKVSTTILSITNAAINRINEVLDKYGVVAKIQISIEKK